MEILVGFGCSINRVYDFPLICAT